MTTAENRVEKQPAAYIVASQRNGTLYVGVTSDLPGRVYQHREGLIDGFTKRYGVKLLVWFEIHESMEAAIVREKQLKNWRRAWKLLLIEAENPTWRDLAEDWGFDPVPRSSSRT
jgi:putative endonuclease